MPESRKRKKSAYTPPPIPKSERKEPVKFESPRWIPITMVTCFVIGLAWIVVWYIAPANPIQAPLSSWNVAVGFGFIAVGFILSTRWR